MIRPASRKQHQVISIVLIVFVAAVFRLINVDRWIWGNFGYDESRDMLVARHIVEFGEHVRRGPLAAGSSNLIMNSPLYYYLIAGLWFFGRSPYGVKVLWAVIAGAVLFAVYKTGERMRDTIAGVCFLGIMAFHPSLVAQGTFVNQPMFLPVWLFIMLWCLADSKITYKKFIFYAVILFFGPHIHLSSLLVVPVFGIWLGYRLWEDTGRKTGTSVVFAAVWYELLGYLWIFATYRRQMFDQIRFVSAYAARSIPAVIAQTGEFLRVIVDGARADMHPVFLYALFIAGCAGLLKDIASGIDPGYIRTWKVGLLASFFIPLTIIGWYGGIVQSTYMLVLLVLALMIAAYAIRSFIGLHAVAGGIAGLVICAYLGWRSFLYMHDVPVTSLYMEQRNLARAIYHDYLSQEIQDPEERPDAIPSFVLATLYVDDGLMYDGWGTGSTWYWLEYLYRKKLVRLIDASNSYQHLVHEPVFFYVICERGEKDQDATQCRNIFERARDYLSHDATAIYGSDVYSVWRYSIEKYPAGQGYNVIYNDGHAISL